MDGDVFLFEKMTPLGEEEEGALFLPLESVGSPRADADGRSLQSLIAAEKDVLAGASITEFKARADTSGSGDLGASRRKVLSPSRTNIRSAVVEENADFIPLDMSGVETVVEEVAQDKRKPEETLGSKEIVESGEHEMRPMSKHPWRESDWFKERAGASQEPDNFHQVHLPQVFDVGALTYLLESKGIAPLVWGEMAAYAYHSRTDPTRLFFIIRDNLFGLAIDTLTRAGLERKTTFCWGDLWGEEEALHKPYIRFKLRQHCPGELIHTYLQLFSASEVALSGDSRAWENSGTFSVDSRYPSPAVLRHFGLSPKLHYGFLVTSQADYFAIALHLIHMTLIGGFEDRDVGGALLRLESMIRDVFETADGSPLEFADIYVPEKYAEVAFLLFSGLPTFLPAIKERDPRGSRLRRKQDGVGTNKRVYLRTWATEK